MSPRIKTVTAAADRAPRPALWRRVLATSLKGLSPLVLLAAGFYVAWTIYGSGPVAERKDRPRVARLVEVVEIAPATQGPILSAWGEAVPARRLLLRPEVSGRIVSLHPNLTAGGFVAKGEEILRIDDRELKLALQRAEADVLEVRARIAIERGQAEIGRRELTRLTRNLTDEQRSLVLREPQMAQLEAELAAAEAAVAQAALAVDRAVVVAPFDAIVLSEQVSDGTMLSQGAEAAELVAADRFNLTLAVPAGSLDWIDTEGGQRVHLTQRGVWTQETFREGRIERLNSRLSETGRMAEVIVAIDDPMALTPENAGQPRVLLGAFLHADIPGRPITEAVRLDRTYLRAGDTVWVMTPEDKLEIRPVTVAWRGADEVLISHGLAAGDRIITTPLSTVADGMSLRLREQGAQG